MTMINNGQVFPVTLLPPMSVSLFTQPIFLKRPSKGYIRGCFPFVAVARSSSYELG